jgi:DNA-damage-inducible protein D
LLFPQFAQAAQAAGFDENAKAARTGGRVAGDARRDLERQLNRSVVSRSNFLDSVRKKDPERLMQAGAKSDDCQ